MNVFAPDSFNLEIYLANHVKLIWPLTSAFTFVWSCSPASIKGYHDDVGRSPNNVEIVIWFICSWFYELTY